MFNLRVRKQVGVDRYVKIGLQLYQVDQKSFLLDFRSFEPSQGKFYTKFKSERLINIRYIQ